jgi:hypothetical protein
MNLHKQIALTFDSEYARQRPLLEFITYNHLLADAAKECWLNHERNKGTPALSGVVIHSVPEETGKGHFFIYAIDEQSVQQKRTLHPVVVLEDGWLAPVAAQTLLGQIQRGAAHVNVDLADEQLRNADEVASQWIAEQRDRIRLEAEQYSTALIKGRSAALKQSFDAKIKRLRETRSKVQDSRLLRLYDGQIRNLEAQCDEKLTKLEEGTSVSVSYDLVAIGRLQIIEGPEQ